MEQKIIALICMHGRHKTVKYCFDKLPFIDKLVVYSTDEDRDFLKTQNVMHSIRVPNEPLCDKWGAGVRELENHDFDAVVILGSDDYVDMNFMNFIDKNIKDYDMIGFTDAYFEKNKQRFYWGGYPDRRKGEPAGAGKVYSYSFLRKIGFNLYDPLIKSSPDNMAHKKCIQHKANMLITSHKEQNTILVDVKDEPGVNTMEKLHAAFTLKLVN